MVRKNEMSYNDYNVLKKKVKKIIKIRYNHKLWLNYRLIKMMLWSRDCLF